MAIMPLCDKCGTELSEFGAILLSPPDEYGMVKKMHLCKRCYEELSSLMHIGNSDLEKDGVDN